MWQFLNIGICGKPKHVTGTQHEVMLFLLLSCNIKESELPRLATHVASVQILLLKVRKLGKLSL